MTGAAGAVVLALALGSCGGASSRPAKASASEAAATATLASAVTEAPCAAATSRTAARAAGEVAERIYESELSSTEVRSDQRQVESYRPLLAALASGNRAAVREAVTELVYSHTHVVRLRVMRGGRLIADVGGPYIIAPVGGSLRSGGRTIGHYLLSVQDDSGYIKIESRFIAVPVLLRGQGRALPVEGNLPAAGVPRAGAYRWHGRGYEVYSFAARAYPSGMLDVSLLVPALAPSSATCRQVRVAELAQVAEHVWRRFELVGAPVSAFVTNDAQLTGALTYVRSGGRQLAGTGRGPLRLPSSGSVSYRGRRFEVRSFAARAGGASARVFLLFPA